MKFSAAHLRFASQLKMFFFLRITILWWLTSIDDIKNIVQSQIYVRINIEIQFF